MCGAELHMGTDNFRVIFEIPQWSSNVTGAKDDQRSLNPIVFPKTCNACHSLFTELQFVFP